MERLSRAIGPLATNVHVLADATTREAIAIDTATPSLAWIAEELAERNWTLKLIVSTHGHWDHIGDNAALAEQTKAQIAVHPLDRDRLEQPTAVSAPCSIHAGTEDLKRIRGIPITSRAAVCPVPHQAPSRAAPRTSPPSTATSEVTATRWSGSEA